MASNDLSADISLVRLPPASSVRPVPDQPAKNDPDRNRRRRPPREEGVADDTPANPIDGTEHQIDSLA